MEPREIEEERYRLKSGVELFIITDSEDLDIAVLANFLAFALRRMKEVREELANDPHAPRLCHTEAFGHRRNSTHYGIRFDDPNLSLDHLVQALASAYSIANTLEQIIDDHQAWAERAASEPRGGMSDIIQSCTEPGGKRRAWALMLAKFGRVSQSP